MSRRSIVIFASASLTMLAVGLTLLGMVMAARANLASTAFGGLAALVVVGGVLGFVSWLLGLMRTAGQRRWDWFVAILVLGPLGALIYGLVDHEEGDGLARHVP
jgi:hypothetical protein